MRFLHSKPSIFLGMALNTKTLYLSILNESGEIVFPAQSQLFL